MLRGIGHVLVWKLLRRRDLLVQRFRLGMRFRMGLSLRFKMHEELVMSNSRLVTFIAIAGAACGAALIGTSIVTRNGWAMLLPYIVLGIVSVVFLRSNGITSFRHRFVLPFASYVFATLIIEAYIFTVVNPQRIHRMTFPSLIGPLVAMLLIGIVGSLVVAMAARYRSDRIATQTGV